MPPNRKDKLKLKAKKPKLSENKDTLDCKVTDDPIDEDICVIIDGKEPVIPYKHTDGSESLPFDLASLRSKLGLAVTQSKWNFNKTSLLSDLPTNAAKDSSREVTTSDIPSNNCSILPPLPPSCLFCYKQFLKTNIDCKCQRCVKKPAEFLLKESSKTIPGIRCEISSDGIEENRNINPGGQMREAHGRVFVGDNFPHARSGNKNFDSQFEKLESKDKRCAENQSVNEKNEVKRPRQESFVKNDVSNLNEKSDSFFDEKSLKTNYQNKVRDDNTEELSLKGDNPASYQVQCCPLCQMQFPPGSEQLLIDSHIATCLSEAEDDVVW